MERVWAKVSQQKAYNMYKMWTNKYDRFFDKKKVWQVQLAKQVLSKVKYIKKSNQHIHSLKIINY